VHRHLHATQGSVYAYPPEVDEWWSSRRMRLEPDPAVQAHLEPGRKRAALGVVASASVLAVGVAMFIVRDRGELPPAPRVRFTVAAPEGSRLSRLPSPAVSPDGRRLVFVATSSSGTESLWIRSLDSLTVTQLPGTEAGLFPFWSPDSRFVGFFARGQLAIADISGGPTRVVCDSPGFYGGTWSKEGVILFAPTHRGIFQVPASGGAPVEVTTMDPAAHEIQHMWPEFLPDGRRFLFLSNAGPAGQRSVRLGSLDAPGASQLILKNASHAAFAPPDSLMFVRDHVLLAQRFDSTSARILGEPLTIASDVGVRQPIGRAAFSVSASGVLVYRTAEAILSQPIVFDRLGRQLLTVAAPADHDQPRFSPDGSVAAVGMANPRGTPGRMLWLLDLVPGQQSHFNLGSTGSGPVWSPDGKALAFTGRREGPGDLYRRPAATGPDEPLLRSPEWKIVTDWSADAKRLIYQQQDLKTQWNVWALELAGLTQTPILESMSNEQHGRLSPDGRWIAYTSDESGRFEIYVRQFPPSSQVWKVSAEGAMQPEWRRDGQELYYVTGNRQLVARSVQNGERLLFGPAQTLFTLDTDGVMTTPGTFHYSAAADGQRFLVNTAIGPGTPTMTVVLNWTTAIPER